MTSSRVGLLTTTTSLGNPSPEELIWAIWDNQNPYYMPLFCQMLSHQHRWCVWYKQSSPRAASAAPSACHLGHNLLRSTSFAITAQYNLHVRHWSFEDCKLLQGTAPKSGEYNWSDPGVEHLTQRTLLFIRFSVSSSSHHQCLESVSQSIPSMIGY